jgi:threonine/homoserine/homoserine lactone efflux protein
MNDLIPIALVITLEPVPVVGFILVLSTERGTRNGAAYIVAWVASLVTIIVATLLFTGGEPIRPTSAPARGVYLALVVLGLLLLAYAFRRSRKPVVENPPQPAWVQRIDNMRPRGAAALGFLLQPWPLVAAGSATVMSSDSAKASDVVQLVAFVVVSTASIAAMEIYSLAAPEAARAKLDALHSWIDRHRNRAVIVLAALTGLYLITKGIYGFVS